MFICLIFLEIYLVTVFFFHFVFGVVLLMVQWKVWFLDMFVSESLADVDCKIWKSYQLDQLIYLQKLCLEHVFLYFECL